MFYLGYCHHYRFPIYFSPYVALFRQSFAPIFNLFCPKSCFSFLPCGRPVHHHLYPSLVSKLSIHMSYPSNSLRCTVSCYFRFFFRPSSSPFVLFLHPVSTVIPLYKAIDIFLSYLSILSSFEFFFSTHGYSAHVNM